MKKLNKIYCKGMRLKHLIYRLKNKQKSTLGIIKKLGYLK